MKLKNMFGTRSRGTAAASVLVRTHSTHTAKAVVAMGVVAVALLSGCTAGGDSPSEGELTGTIRMLVEITPAKTLSYYEGLVAPYVESHPGVKVVFETPSTDGPQGTLQQGLASGDIPDIVQSNLDPVVAPQLLGFPDEAWVMDTPFVSANTLDGQIYKVATAAQIQSLVFYNKDAFDEAGITTLPKSIDEFTAALKKLKAAGYLPLQTAGEWVTGSQLIMMAQPDLMTTNPDFFAQATSGEATFADSAYATYMEAYEGWVKDGLVSDQALGLKYEDAIAGFTSGKAATIVMGNWLVNSIDEANPTFPVGVFPTPTIDGSTPRQYGNAAQPYSILKDSKNVALALDLVKYLVSDKTAVETALTQGDFRAGYSVTASELTMAVAQVLDDSPGLVSFYLGSGSSAFQDQVNLSVQSLYTGNSSSVAVADIDTWWKTNATN